MSGTVVAGPGHQVPRSRRSGLVPLRAGVDIALAYFNSDNESLQSLTVKAKQWADRYFKGYPYANKRPTTLVRSFPNLFNLNVESHLRLGWATMPSSPSTPEPESSNPRDFRRAERKAMNSESFPAFAEPCLATDAELDEIVQMRPRGPALATKPNMRVDAAALRSSGLLASLPEFLGQLARANLETETMLASNPEAVKFELDEEEAADQQHIEMDVYTGLMEAQKRRHQRRVILPGGRSSKLYGEESGSESESSASSIQLRKAASPDHEAEASGNETDASTSTAASLRANLKRKARPDSSEDEEPANKIRVAYEKAAPPELLRYNLQQRRLESWCNPDADPNDPFVALQRMPMTKTGFNPSANTEAESGSPAPSDHSSSSSSSGRSTRIWRIKIRCSTPSSSGDSRESSPANTKIIVLTDPRCSPSVSSSRSSSSSPGARTILKPKTRKPFPVEPHTHTGSTSSSDFVQRPTTSGSDSSVSSSSSRASSVTRIVVRQNGVPIKSRTTELPLRQARDHKVERKRLIEEVDE
ncbi:hypothetical protein QBC35DRAFT_158658 [Podospora australis]|uniref:Uncharacterized protein n=1 Tax=Podospora australis TaxID=1536484 RepID=A0AAN7AN63_9PEZI|nr:hypothetical protein QBC35DRAFT_158658 [Podospora australis]